MTHKIDQIHDIIKYDPNRNYFGPWSPTQLHNTYRSIYLDPFRPLKFIETGRLSAEIICDTLWNEMSYNPLRFGEQNPFGINDIPNIKDFCRTHVNTKDLNEINTKMASELSHFLYFIGKTNPEFRRLGEICGCSILIDCDRHRKTGYGYKALACLSSCIHYIATQNINDYKIKKYREQIQRIAVVRHPKMKRPTAYLNFVEIDKAEHQKDYLYNAITEKNNEIFETTSLIKTFEEYEPPVDSSHEKNLLSHQKQELQALEQQYVFAKNKYDKLIAHKNEVEKTI